MNKDPNVASELKPHTPLPWNAMIIASESASQPPSRAVVMVQTISADRGEYWYPEDATYAVKAVNMHERLVDCLRKWQHGGTRNHNPVCPECGCMPFGTLDGRSHNAGCTLAALLKEAADA